MRGTLASAHKQKADLMAGYDEPYIILQTVTVKNRSYSK